jgi:DNA polymerase III subunit epsilon
MLTLTRPLVFFDIESTGLDTINDRIVEIAFVKCGLDLRPIEQKHWLLDPGMPIPAAATAVHHITDADVKGKPKFKDVAAEMFAFVAGCDLGGYNLLRFDIPMLGMEFERAGVVFPEEQTKIVDAHTIFIKQEPRNLTAAYALYCNKVLEDAHSALADTIATAEVFFGQVARYEDLPSTVEGLHTFCGADEIVDPGGYLKRLPQGIVYNFGKHKGVPVGDEPGYADWMLQKDFPVSTKMHLSRALGRPWPPPKPAGGKW